MEKSNSNLPEYVKIQQYVTDRIDSGEYAVGSQIPTETELAKQFGVSRITANKAIKELSVKGILKRTRGSGTYVCPKFDSSTDSTAFVSVLNMDIVSRRQHTLIQFGTVSEITGCVEDKFGSDSGPLYEIVLANMKGSRKDSIDFTYIPRSITSDTGSIIAGLRDNYVFDYLKTLPGLSPAYLKIFLVTPDAEMQKRAGEFLECSEEMHVWCTCVYSLDMKLLSSSYTFSPVSNQEIPVFTFSL